MHLTAVFISCLSMIAAGSSPAAADTAVFRNDRYRFDVSYDAAWKPAPAPSNLYLLSLDLPQEIEGGRERCFIAAVDDPPDGRRPDLRFPAGAYRLLRQLLPLGPSVRIDPSAVTAGAAIGFNAVYQQPAADRDYERISLGYLLPVNDAVLVVACISTADRRKPITASLQRLASSLIVR